MKKMTDEEKAMKVDEVLSEFDFQKVYRVMEFLDWKWKGKKPSIYQLMKEAERLLYTVLNKENVSSAGSGGFMAGIDNEQLYLNFILEESSAYFEEKEDEV